MYIRNVEVAESRIWSSEEKGSRTDLGNGSVMVYDGWHRVKGEQILQIMHCWHYG